MADSGPRGAPPRFLDITMSSLSDTLGLYLRLLRFTLPYWRVFAVSVLAMTITAATEPAIPALAKPLLDRSFVSKDVEFMRWVPVGIVAIMLLRGVASFISDYALQWTAQKVIADLRARMFDTLLHLPATFFDHSMSGKLISKFVYDTLQVTSAATGALTVIVKDSLVIIGLLGWLLWENWRLTLVSLTVGPVIVIIVRAFSGRLRQMSRAEQGAMGELNHALEESIIAHKVVKVFDGLEYEADRFHKGSERVRRFNMKAVIAASANVPLTQLAAASAVAVIVHLAINQAARDQTTVGGFVSFLGAMLMLLAPLKRLTNVSAQLQRGLAGAESVFALIDENRELDKGQRDIGRARGALAFRDVHFTYATATRPALCGLDLEIAAGETVALVGSSGSGKTTTANMVPRFYDPTSGQILLDGIDLRDLTLASLRANIALVSQDVVLFNDTVAGNIAYGRLARVGRDQVIAAARAANALEFIEAMPQGFDTLIGENGVRLSGGQRQRIAIARAFLKDAPVLILDEATSALDSETERNVQKQLDDLMRGRTTLVIAHRLSTIERADRIVVMQHGRIVEIGRHADLLAAGGAYARLQQMAGQGDLLPASAVVDPAR